MPDLKTPSRILDSSEKLIELCAELKDESHIGLDTEFNRTSTFRPQLCVVQLAASGRLECVDMLAGMDVAPLRSVLAGAPGVKLIHAAKQDIEALYLTCAILPGPLFDTQIAAGLLGHQPQIGYAGLVKSLLNVILDKDATRTDWSRRPLSAKQMAYASNDVRYLLPLYEKLEAALFAAGRLEWAREDSTALLNPGLYESPPEIAWQRLRSIPFLPVPAQARARRLAAWREGRATQVDRPRQWVLSDKALLAIAETDPRDVTSLARTPDLAPAIARRQGRQLLEVIAAANIDVAAGRVNFEQQTRPESPDSKRMKELGHVVKCLATELGIAAEMLATRRDLSALLRGDQPNRVLAGWRRSVVGDALLAAL